MKSLKVNVPHIVHEIFSDDEAAIINLKTGNYYSLNPTGAEVWSLIEKNATSEEIIEVFSECYKNESVEDVIKKFVTELLEEDLIIESEENIQKTQELRLEKANGNFVEPEMERFGDMQELLLLDPIHDVDDAGFPHKKTAAQN